MPDGYDDEFWKQVMGEDGDSGPGHRGGGQGHRGRQREEDEPPVTFENVVCLKLAASGKAILCQIPAQEKEVWIPLSQVHADSEVFNDSKNSSGKLVISHWIATEKNLV